MIYTAPDYDAHTPVPWRDMSALGSHVQMIAMHLAQDLARADRLDEVVQAHEDAKRWYNQHCWGYFRAQDAAIYAHERARKAAAA